MFPYIRKYSHVSVYSQTPFIWIICFKIFAQICLQILNLCKHVNANICFRAKIRFTFSHSCQCSLQNICFEANICKALSKFNIQAHIWTMLIFGRIIVMSLCRGHWGPPGPEQPALLLGGGEERRDSGAGEEGGAGSRPEAAATGQGPEGPAHPSRGGRRGGWPHRNRDTQVIGTFPPVSVASLPSVTVADPQITRSENRLWKLIKVRSK